MLKIYTFNPLIVTEGSHDRVTLGLIPTNVKIFSSTDEREIDHRRVFMRSQYTEQELLTVIELK